MNDTDRHGASQSASCKTGLFSGEYFTDDRTARAVQPLAITRADREIATPERENQRLRAEIDRIKSRGA